MGNTKDKSSTILGSRCQEEVLGNQGSSEFQGYTGLPRPSSYCLKCKKMCYAFDNHKCEFCKSIDICYYHVWFNENRYKLGPQGVQGDQEYPGIQNLTATPGRNKDYKKS